MKNKFKIVLSAVCLAAILVGPSAAFAGESQNNFCHKPCLERT